MADKTGTIFQRLETKIDNLQKKAEKQAERKIMKQRISVMVSGLNFWERCELVMKIFL